MRKYLAIIAMLFLSMAISAQKHDNLLLWGYDETPTETIWGGMVLDFSEPKVRLYAQKRKIDLGFYVITGIDSSGRLLYYTNGISIRDTTHNRMLNGDTINPGPVWEQMKDYDYPNGPFGFSLPAPGMPNCYYMFHMGSSFIPTLSTAPFYYTLINMALNNDKGAVVEKNKIILPLGSDYTAPVAVKHGNGRDWWIITGEVSTPLIHTFLLDPAGVHGPFTTTMPYQFPGDEYQSVNDISPDGQTYVRCDDFNGLYIYNFNRCSGAFSNLKVMPFGDEDFWCITSVFGPDSKKLYLSTFSGITAVDLSAPDISASFDTLAWYDGNVQPLGTGFFNPNLFPDGKIYYATTNSNQTLHVIHNPELPGFAADAEQHGLFLPKLNNGSMCLYPNYRLAEWEASPCDTLNGQRPGDGFIKTDYLPSEATRAGYTLLPPLIRKPAGQRREGPAPERPPIQELVRRQLEARKEQH
ncbi:MAG: hypothetical protein J0L99_21600 [Chitinophagales bacterium]|nr:hypothetical protein [Chitinophagales bacterium]